MLLWWKEYIHEWKMNLFIILQMVVVLFFVNTQVSFLVEEWGRLNSLTKTEDNMYFYENAIATIGGDAGFWEDFQYAEKKLAELDGMEGIACAAETSCQIDGYQNKITIGDYIQNANMNPLLWKGMQYPLEKGRWFQEQDAGDDILQVIIGGGLSERYKVGDSFTLLYDNDIKREALVIGDLGTDFGMLDNACTYTAAGETVDVYVTQHGADEDILLSNDTRWFEELQEEAVYPSTSAMLKIKPGTDLTVYEKYGVLSSFDTIMENTKERRDGYVMSAINYNAIWIIVIIFGVAGVAYLMAQRRRYVWGIYSLLGMSGRQMLGRLMLQNLLTYVLGTVAACLAAPYISNILNYAVAEVTMENVIAMGVLIGILFAVSYLCNLYIGQVEPKEILTQTKE